MFVINQGYLRIIRVLISLVNEDEQNLIMIDIVKVGCLKNTLIRWISSTLETQITNNLKLGPNVQQSR